MNILNKVLAVYNVCFCFSNAKAVIPFLLFNLASVNPDILSNDGCFLNKRSRYLLIKTANAQALFLFVE